MTEQPPDEAARKKKLADVFGDVLPETTSDEREQDDDREESEQDTWYRDQVPPHHG